MADDSVPVTPISILFKLLVPPNDPLSVNGLESLSLDDQLDISNIDKLSTAESIDAMISTLCSNHQIVDLAVDSPQRDKFRSVLTALYEQHIVLNHIPISEYDHKQIPFSFFLYLMDRLRRHPVDAEDQMEFEKDRKKADSMWMFIDHLIAFCNEERWNGKMMNDLSALHLVKRVCSRFELKMGHYARIRKLLPMWYQKQRAQTEETEHGVDVRPRFAERARFEQRSRFKEQQNLQKAQDDDEEVELLLKLIEAKRDRIPVRWDRLEDSSKFTIQTVDHESTASELSEEEDVGDLHTMTSFGAMRQYLCDQQQVAEVEVDELEEMLDDEQYDTDTLKLDFAQKRSNLERWSKSKSAITEYIPRFLRGTECMYLIQCNLAEPCFSA